MNSFITLIALSVVAVAHGVVYTPNVVTAHGAIVAPNHIGVIQGAIPYDVAAPQAVGVIVPKGSGLEGQYVPDRSEHLYDDGFYKPSARIIPLAPSPYGLVPAGSGLEGQYVHDLTEKLYDDGSYRQEHHYGHH